MADITYTLPDDVQALFHVVGATLRSVSSGRRIVLYHGKYLLEVSNDPPTFEAWQCLLMELVRKP